MNYPIYPVQETDNPWDNIPKPAFVGPDNSIYNSSSPYPLEMVNLTNDGFFDGSNHIITLEIMPFQYSAVNKKLYYYPVLSVTVYTTSFSYNIIAVQQRLTNDQIKINNTLERLVDNSQDISKYQVVPNLTNQRVSGNNPSISFYEYVIITTATLKPYFDDFVDWKRKKGLNIGVVTTAQIFSNYSGDLISGINDDAGKIRQYLADGYSQGTMYALLAGDYNTVPIRYGNTSDNEPGLEALVPADLYFADFNGDWDVDGDMYLGEFAGDNVDYYNEIYVSRLLCNENDAANISNWIKKVLIYEQNPGNGNYAYLTRNLIDQADDAQVDNYAGSISSSYPYYFNNTVKQEIPGALVPDPTNPTGTEIVDAINNNYYGIFSYNGHGDPTSFYVRTTNPAYNDIEFPTSRLVALSDYASNSDGALDQLTNGDYPTILHSVGCEVMPFDDYQPNGSYSYNMGESWTLLGDYGGPSMIGNTRLGSLQSINLFTNFLQSEFPNPNKGVNLNSSENPADIGYNFWNGKSNYVGQGDYHYIILSTNLLGCPQTEYWRSTPVKFENISIIDNGTSITVNTNNISGCKISVSSIYPSGNFQEVVENETEHTFTTSVRPLFITISKHYYNNANDKFDYIPYQAITGGTYSDDIIVNYWNELHIPQGSYLKFANGAKIDVKGKLFVEGTSTNNVTFTSSNATPNKSDWSGINLDGVNANIIMKYSNLEYSTFGIKFNNGATGIIENSSISNNYYGIYISSSEPVINNNSVYNNNYGIYISNSYTPQWTVININDNNITNNSSYGLYAYNSSPNLYNNSINNNARGVALLFNSNPIFDHNSISSNTYYGLLCYGSSSPSLYYSSSYNYGG